MEHLSINSLFSYVVWIEKGYQDVQVPHGASIIKVKGVARISVDDTNSTASKFFLRLDVEEMNLISVRILRQYQRSSMGYG